MAGGYCVLNFKSYPNSVGKRSLELAKAAEEVANELKKEIIVCPSNLDLQLVAKSVKIPVYAQHVDINKAGAFTGSIPAQCIKQVGGSGSIINHSEKRITMEQIELAVLRCKEAGIKSVVCTENAYDAKHIALFEPDFIAIEPPELIGTGVSVSTADPGIVKNTVFEINRISKVNQLREIPVLCGAGVSNGGDIKTAMELGAKGVLLASAFVNAKEPKKLLLDMARNL